MWKKITRALPRALPGLCLVHCLGTLLAGILGMGGVLEAIPLAEEIELILLGTVVAFNLWTWWSSDNESWQSSRLLSAILVTIGIMTHEVIVIAGLALSIASSTMISRRTSCPHHPTHPSKI